MNPPNHGWFPDHFKFFKYEREEVEKRLRYIFDKVWHDKYVSWIDAGMPFKEDPNAPEGGMWYVYVRVLKAALHR